MAENQPYQPASSTPAGLASTTTQPSFFQRVRDDLFRPRPKESKESKKKAKDAPKGDTTREVVETVVFVVVLVLMLKAFVAEAFIIPTGSMATTLLGYHRDGHCTKCGHDFTVNASADADEFRWFQTGPPSSAMCPNCRNIQELASSYNGGDKVLVLKPQYDLGWPQRWDVIVFKFPGKSQGDGQREGGPQENFSAKNYIKRLWGLPGEKLSIWHGDVYLVTVGADGKPVRSILRKPRLKIMDMRRLVNDNDLQASDLQETMPAHWADEGTGTGWTSDDTKSFRLTASTEERRLQYRNLLRPPPLPTGALRRYAASLNQMTMALEGAEREKYQGRDALARARDQLGMQLTAMNQLTLLPTKPMTEELRALTGRIEITLKTAEDSLANLSKPADKEDNPLGSVFNPKDTLRHELSSIRDSLKEIQDQWKAALDTAQSPQLVTDFLGYNAGITGNPNEADFPRDLTRGHEPHWVKDLMLDCEVEITQPGGELTIELNAGVEVHQAKFDLATGSCTLRVVRHGENPRELEVAAQTATTSLKGTGRHQVQFANFDDRLILWIDGSTPFGAGLDFAGPGAADRGPRAGDVKPVSIIGKGAALQVRRLKLWRDIYYTRSPRDTPEYEEVRFVDRSALGMASFLSVPSQDQALPPAGRIAAWDGFAKQKPWYYPSGKWNGGESRPEEQADGPVLGPDEYFALGDNSTRSSDSRDWGPVPERLLLGKAVFVYWPIPSRFRLIW